MQMRRGFFRLMLLATLGWVAFVAYNAWGTMPRGRMPVTVTQLSDYCRFAFRVSSDMSPYVVRYEAVAQYHHAKISVHPGADGHRSLTLRPRRHFVNCVEAEGQYDLAGEDSLANHLDRCRLVSVIELHTVGAST